MKSSDVCMDFLRKNVNIFEIMEDDKLKLILDNSRIKNLKKGEVLFKKGQYASYFYVVLNGILRETATDKNDFCISFWENRRGEYFGEVAIFLGEGYQSTVIARSDSSLLCVPKDILLMCARNDNRMLLAIIKVLNRRLQTAARKEIGYTQMDAEGRVAYSLMDYKNRGNTGSTIYIMQDQLAASCGIARQTVSKILNKWKRGGIVALNRGSIVVLDEDGLSDIYLSR